MPVTLHQLLKTMVERGGSDLHITTNSPPQIRIDGKLTPLDMPPLTAPETKQLAYSVLTDASDYPGTGANPSHNTNGDPAAISQYCNGSRWPPEFGSAGYQVPPGIADATVPNPVFSLTPSATVDEGNNWINLS